MEQSTLSLLLKKLWIARARSHCDCDGITAAVRAPQASSQQVLSGAIWFPRAYCSRKACAILSPVAFNCSFLKDNIRKEEWIFQNALSSLYVTVDPLKIELQSKERIYVTPPQVRTSSSLPVSVDSSKNYRKTRSTQPFRIILGSLHLERGRTDGHRHRI